MTIPEKFSIVGYWHPRAVYWGTPWEVITHYILLDEASKSVQSYWVKPLKPMSRGGLKKVRRRLRYSSGTTDTELVTKEEYIKRWNARVLQIEQENMWIILNQK